MKVGVPDLGSLRKRADLKRLAGSGASAAVTDLYRDLRDRRLLPFVGVLLVAIVAVPIVLGTESKGGGDATARSPIAVLREASEKARASSISVVESDPGLRDYRKRLGSRGARNPFRQHYTGSVLKGAKLNDPKSTSQTGGSATSTSKTVEEGSSQGQSGGSRGQSGGSQGQGGGSQGKGGGSNPSNGTLYTYAIDVTIVRTSGSKADGDLRKGKPEKRARVLPTTSLPSRQAEVVNYVGVGPENRRPVFVISTDVTAVFGEGHCISGSDRCQLIELEKGFPETFVREGGDRIKIKVTGMRVVGVAGKHARAGTHSP